MHSTGPPAQTDTGAVASYRPTRRRQLRDDTTTAIKTTALGHLRAHGAQALSLRAVARDLGMSSAGLYRYYAGRDELLTALIADAYGDLADHLIRARDAAGATVRQRLRAACHAYFDWSSSHRAEFSLIFGPPVEGYEAPPDGPTTVAAQRFSAVFLDLLSAAHAEPVDRPSAGLPLEAAIRAATCWSRLHGVVALGIFGHLLPTELDASQVRKLYDSVVESTLDEFA